MRGMRKERNIKMLSPWGPWTSEHGSRTQAKRAVRRGGQNKDYLPYIPTSGIHFGYALVFMIKYMKLSTPHKCVLCYIWRMNPRLPNLITSGLSMSSHSMIIYILKLFFNSLKYRTIGLFFFVSYIYTHRM